MRKQNLSSPGVYAWETVFIQLGGSPIYGAFRGLTDPKVERLLNEA